MARPLIVVLVLALLAPPAWAQGPAASQPASRPRSAPTSKPAADLDALERALAADLAQRKAARTAPSALTRVVDALNPNIALILDVAGAAFFPRAPEQLGAHDPRINGFSLQQVELSVGAAVDPYFRFDAYLVFSGEGVEVEEAFGTTLSLPFRLQARAGLFLTRFGRHNSTHPHAWQFVDQPLVLGKLLGGEGNRGAGVELSILLPLPWYVEILVSATQAAGAATARSFYGDNDLGVESPADLQYTAALKQFFALGPDWSLLVGLSGAFGPNSSGRGNRTEIIGADVVLKYRPISRASYTSVSLEGEWLLRRRQLPWRVHDHGLYAQLAWRFARRWGAAGRYEYTTGVVDDPLDPAWTGLRQRVATNLTFWPTEFSRLRLQYRYDRPSWRPADHGLILALELVIGAHGAHKF